MRNPGKGSSYPAGQTGDPVYLMTRLWSPPEAHSEPEQRLDSV